jgi:putative NADPH-quinone reductase
MPHRILILIGHPDPAPERFCRALAAAYAEGAREAGHQVRTVDIANLNFPWLSSGEQFERGALPESLKEAAGAIAWADHIVIIFPLWLGTMPALLKAFLEQVMRPGVAFSYPEDGNGFPKKLLSGRSARVVVTMGMPGLLYSVWYRGHGLAGLRRNILNFVGIDPVRTTLFGMVADGGEPRHAAWLEKMRSLGADAR